MRLHLDDQASFTTFYNFLLNAESIFEYIHIPNLVEQCPNERQNNDES